MRQSREQPGPVTYGRPPPPPPRSVLKERADKFGEEDEEEEQATGEAGANGSTKPKSRLSRLRFRNWPHSLQIIWCTIAYTLGISAITVFFFEHVGSLLWITGRSMAPSLNEDFGIKDMWRDCVVVKRWNPALDLKRGMIVVFPSPHDPSNIAVKRVIGLPGDCVTTRYPCPKEKRFLDWNHVWVEGDIEDPKETRDSNTYGPISLGLITGQAIAVLYPRPRRLKWQDWEEAEEGTIAAAQRNRVQRSAIEVLNPDII
ncbi:hypothetical protein KEM55_006990 [Ascosphaera atra]|nr:hypothetical protein KEM55_006990 [Ascosphaera atra]